MNLNEDKSGAEIGEANFDSEVLRSRRPVLVAFLAPWSRPCRTVGTVLDEVAAVCAGRVKVVKVNADDNPHLGFWYEIQAIPTLLYFVGGSLRAKIVGNVGKEKILAKLQPVSGSGASKFSTPENEHHTSHEP